jgi:hypothetical protein
MRSTAPCQPSAGATRHFVAAARDAARGAAAALLAEHPELRPLALADLDDPNSRQLRLVYAAGLQNASGGLADALGEALAVMKPKEQIALAFARDCDRDFLRSRSARR